MVAYNSKVYYVITQGAGLGDNVRRLPITGNETVLDAISQINGLSQVSSKKIWIARPAPHNFGCQQILPIDWDAITQGAQTATNYQILPGDRLFVAEDELVTFTNVMDKVTAPIERLAGILALGDSTIRGFQTMGRNYNRQPQWILAHENIITPDHRFECRWRGPAVSDAARNGICPVVYDSADLQPQRPVQAQHGELWVQRHELAAMAGAGAAGGAKPQRRLEASPFRPRRAVLEQPLPHAEGLPARPAHPGGSIERNGLAVATARFSDNPRIAEERRQQWHGPEQSQSRRPGRSESPTPGGPGAARHSRGP